MHRFIFCFSLRVSKHIWFSVHLISMAGNNNAEPPPQAHSINWTQFKWMKNAQTACAVYAPPLMKHRQTRISVVFIRAERRPRTVQSIWMMVSWIVIHNNKCSFRCADTHIHLGRIRYFFLLKENYDNDDDGNDDVHHDVIICRLWPTNGPSIQNMVYRGYDDAMYASSFLNFKWTAFDTAMARQRKRIEK